MLGLVAQSHAFLGALGRLPAGRHLLPHFAEHGLELVRREIRIHHVDEITCDAVLLAQQRATRDFRRMRREHGLDFDRRERTLDLVCVDPLRLQLLADVDEAKRLGHGRVAQVRATAADAVHLLRHVDHLEVRRERANEIARSARCQRAEQRGELAIGVAVALALRDGELARGLDEIEQRLATLLAHELADERAQAVHVLAERAVLLGKEDIRANRRVGRRHLLRMLTHYLVAVFAPSHKSGFVRARDGRRCQSWRRRARALPGHAREGVHTRLHPVWHRHERGLARCACEGRRTKAGGLTRGRGAVDTAPL